jgi:hypothetical protein
MDAFGFPVEVEARGDGQLVKRRRDKSLKQRGRNPKEDIFRNPVAQGRKVQ